MIQYITFPSISIITQIKHLIAFDSTQILVIHSQQRL